MGYVAGETILDDEYNAFVSNSSSPFGYNHIAGTGSAQYGLGQTEIAVTSAGATVQASQWNALMTGIINIVDLLWAMKTSAYHCKYNESNLQPK